MTASPAQQRVYHIYCDESSHIGKQDYLLFAGMVVEQTRLSQIEDEILSILTRWGVFGELKWGKISRTKLEVYKELLEYVWDKRPVVHFNAFVVRRSSLDHWKLHGTSYNQALDNVQAEHISQMICAHIQHGHRCDIYIDERQTLPALAAMQRHCNHLLSLEWDYPDETIRSIRSIDSHDSQLLQIADVLMGAIAFDINGLAFEENASPAKVEAMRFVQNLVGVSDFRQPIDYGSSQFAVWYSTSGYNKKRHMP